MNSAREGSWYIVLGTSYKFCLDTYYLLLDTNYTISPPDPRTFP